MGETKALILTLGASGSASWTATDDGALVGAHTSVGHGLTEVQISPGAGGPGPLLFGPCAQVNMALAGYYGPFRFSFKKNSILYCFAGAAATINLWLELSADNPAELASA
jgi:hypothetical protein